MRNAQVDFLFDFGSPNAYLAHKVVPKIEAQTGCRFNYVPILLGGLFKLTNNRSPIEAFSGVKHKLEYEKLERERFVQKHELHDFRWNPHFPIRTIQLMRGAVVAQHLDVLQAYVDAVFAGLWEQQLKMDDPEVAASVLQGAGLDAEKILTMTETANVKEELIANTDQAFKRGAFGLPTFFLGDEIYFGKDRLRDIQERLMS